MEPSWQKGQKKKVYAKAEYPCEHSTCEHRYYNNGYNTKWQPVQVAPRHRPFAGNPVPKVCIGCNRYQADDKQGCQYHTDVVLMRISRGWRIWRIVCLSFLQRCKRGELGGTCLHAHATSPGRIPMWQLDDIFVFVHLRCPPIWLLRSRPVAPSSKFTPFRRAFFP